jgi:hypothetical protein
LTSDFAREVIQFLNEISQGIGELEEALNARNLSPAANDGFASLNVCFKALNDKFTIPKYFWSEVVSSEVKPKPGSVSPKPDPERNIDPYPASKSNSDASGLSPADFKEFKEIIREIPAIRNAP